MVVPFLMWFFVAYTAPSFHVVLISRIAPTSICSSSRKAFDSHQPMNRFSRRFLYLRTVSPARCRALASSMNFVTVGLKIGGEGGIRTHVPVTRQDAFEAPPLRPLRYLSGLAACDRSLIIPS